MILKKLILTIIATFPSTKNWFNQVRLTFRKIFNLDYEKDVDYIPEELLNKECLAIDIGANRGDFTQSLISRGFKVIAFEPNPIPFELMQRRFKNLNTMTLDNVACGSEIHKLQLFIPCYKKYQIEGLASFNKKQVLEILDKIRFLRPYYFFDKKYVHYKSVNVDIVKLDDYKLHPHFIKIDTEGYESEVVNGALKTIKSYKPVLYIESPDLKTLNLLIELGYQQSFIGKNNQILIHNSSLEK